ADKQPILVITGETSTHIFGKGGLQESSGEGGSIDQSALFSGITKYHKIIERTDYLGNVLNRVAKILLSPNSGPVMLSIPYNVQKELVDESVLDVVKTRKHFSAVRETSFQIHEIVDLIAHAKAPVIVAGYGCVMADAQTLVDGLSEQLSIPVTTSLKAKGVISEQSGRSLGSLGVTSSGFAYQYIVEQADLIIFLGAGFNERTSYVWNENLLRNKKIIQIDQDPEQLEKVFKADVAIHGDIKTVLTGVVELVDDRALVGKELALNDWRSEQDAASIFKPDQFSLVEQFYHQLEQKVTEDILIFDDNIIFAQNFYQVSRGNRYYPNSGISSLGHAIPAAIGARFSQDKPVFAILGDGGFQMCCMELMTAANYNIPITVIMFSNATMGLIRKNQHQQYDERFIDCDFVNPDYALLAQSFGLQYFHVTDEKSLSSLFTEADFNQQSNLVELVIDKDAFPNYISRR
ncbi:MAG: thiamine pyrophosphate-binding protein, partial [Methylococcales bacterium]|nr:thiamine pyrophosphate-binding protein [Methylococcales bacterium]